MRRRALTGSIGWGGMVDDGVDYLSVVEAYDRALDAAARLNSIEDVAGRIRQLVESNESTSVSFVRQSLHGRLRAYLSSVHEM